MHFLFKMCKHVINRVTVCMVISRNGNFVVILLSVKLFFIRVHTFHRKDTSKPQKRNQEYPFQVVIHKI